MQSASDDMIDLLTEAGRRLIERMTGLGNEKWQWQPFGDDPRVTIRRCLDRIAETLGEERN